MELAEQLDPEEWSAIMQRYICVMRFAAAPTSSDASSG